MLLALIIRSLKKAVHKQTTKLLNDNNIYKYQSGFRSTHSPDLFLSFLNDKVLKGFDNGFYNSMILIDLQKAFDTINHTFLLHKLLPIGFSKNTTWILFSRASLYCRSCKSGFKLRKYFMCSTRFNFRASTVFDLYKSMIRTNLHLHAHDLCLLFQHKEVPEINLKNTIGL